LTEALGSSSGIQASSSGLFVLEERPISHAMRPLVASIIGVEDLDHISQQSNSKQLSQQDLILCMTREHRSAVLEECPSAFGRTFTLRELARLIESAREEGIVLQAEGSLSEKIRTIARMLSMRRSLLPKLLNPLDDDVKDPYGLADETYREAVDQMLPALKVLTDFLRSVVR
jgi:protein-tyrosine phosphatase